MTQRAQHSVASHLGIISSDYDEAIRLRIPHYDEMLDAVGEALATSAAASGGPILDLGTGTGGLAGRLMARFSAARFVLLDADGAMLSHARSRFSTDGQRVEYVHGTFESSFPDGIGAIVSSLALHHVQSLRAKQTIYERARQALRPGGLFVNADPALPDSPQLEAAAFEALLAHQMAYGFSEAEGRANFELWRSEDRYFPLRQELAALDAAGFAHADVFWRRGGFAVLVAQRG